jgi:hypothetical protein
MTTILLVPLHEQESRQTLRRNEPFLKWMLVISLIFVLLREACEKIEVVTVMHPPYAIPVAPERLPHTHSAEYSRPGFPSSLSAASSGEGVLGRAATAQAPPRTNASGKA